MQDYKIPETDLIIEKGTEVLIPVISIHRDEKYYAQANEFIPDRFNDENPAGKDQINQPFLPFGDGPRNCIGMRLGKMQIKLSLVQMMQKWRYELEDKLKNHKIEIDPNTVFLNPRGVVNLKIFQR